MAVNMEPHAAWWIQRVVSEIRPVMDGLALVVVGDMQERQEKDVFLEAPAKIRWRALFLPLL